MHFGSSVYVHVFSWERKKSVTQQTPNALQPARKRSGSETTERGSASKTLQRRRHAKDKSAMGWMHIN